MKPNIKKLLILNAPYLLFVWLFMKAGEAFRLSPGADLSGKLLHIMEGMTAAFENPMPSLNGQDFLIGVAGAVILRIAVYMKGKNAKKYRKGVEYGSARWGNAKDIEPYIDPDFYNNVLLTQTERLTMNSRPKSPKYARNKNVLVIGGSGSGKTRFFVKPNLMQMHSSYCVTDPKGTIILECGKLLDKGGYRIKVLNTINFKKSMHYNPFAYLHSEKDILKLVNTIMVNTKGEGEKSSEDFWTKAEKLYYTALIGYIYYEAPEEEKNFTTLLDMINASEAREDDEDFKNPVDLMFDRLEEKDPEHFAVKQYKKYKLAAGKTAKSILISCGARLAPFDIKELRELMETDDLELDTLGDRKTALFVIISDTDDTFNFIVAMMYTQLFNLLCDKADDVYGGSDLATYGGDAKDLLRDLQSRNERMFLLTLLVVNLADNKQQLDNQIFQTAGVAQKANCSLVRLDYQQEAGLMSSLPLGLNDIPIQRGLTTSSTAIFVPFTTQELFQNGEALYYGLNALSSNMILADRKKLKNPNGLILGTPGSGKSFSAKREITNVFLVADKKDCILICDPEAEYAPLVNRLGGQVVKISPTSRDFVNPMDLNLNYSEDESPLSLKSNFILSLCELVVGGKSGLEPIEKTVIDRAVREVYREYLADPDPTKMPVLEDLYNALKKQPEAEAARVAAALELYVHGSLNVFNHRTNIDIHNRLVCFDIKELGKQLKKLGMLIIQDQVWGRVTENRELHANTWFYCDEFHLLLKEEQTAAYSVEIWKRFRKWGGIPTGITQNVKDLLASREIENIFENSDFIYMLNQAGGDRQILAKQLGISNKQLSYVTHSEAGQGLIFYGNVILPFVDRFPTDTELYRIMTTRPEELANG